MDELLYYILFLGTSIFITGLIELISPKMMLKFWILLISSKLFWIYGIILIILGFPLTLLTSHILSIPVFIIGLCMVFLGPFIIIYPDKIRNLFIQSLDELSPKGNLLILHIDAIAHMTIGALLISAYVFR